MVRGRAATINRWSRIVLSAAVTVLLVGSFLPWVRTGDRRRNSYALMGLIDRLEFAPGGLAARAVGWWPIVPTLCVLTLIAAWWPRPRTAAVVGLIAALYAGGVAVAVNQAPIKPLAGTTLAADAGIVAALAALVCLATSLKPTRRAGSSPA